MTKQSKVTDRHKEATENNTRKKAIMKEYADWKRHVKIPDMKEGDVVLVKQPMYNKLTPRYNPEPLVVTKVKGTLMEARNRNKFVKRNVSHLKPVKMPVLNQMMKVITAKILEIILGDRTMIEQLIIKDRVLEDHQG